MSELKDPAIKLFGKTIQLPDDGESLQDDVSAVKTDDRPSSSSSSDIDSKQEHESDAKVFIYLFI